MVRVCQLLAGALVVMALATEAATDVVELTTGDRIEGDLKQATVDSVIIEAGGRTLRIDREQVRAIYLSPPARHAPAVPTAQVVEALKHLQALTERPAFDQREYVRELAQSRTIVEQFLKQAGSAEGALRAAVVDAFALYEFAASVWDSRLTNSASASATIGRSPIIDRCPALQRVTANYPPPNSQENAWRRGVAIEFEIPSIWTCASDKVTEAERAVPR